MKVIGYIRVSTTRQVREGLSLAAQRLRIERYAQLHELELVGIEVDEGLSAKPLQRKGKRTGLVGWRASVDRYRPALGRALGALETGAAAGIVVVKLGRLTRSTRDLDYLLDHYFGAGAYQLLSINDTIDTRTANGRLALNVLMSVLQWEREVAAERTEEIVSYKQSNGEYIGGEVPYGCRLMPPVEKAPIQLAPNEDEQAVIRLARELRATGLSLRAVAVELAADGQQNRSGRPFHAEQIRRML